MRKILALLLAVSSPAFSNALPIHQSISDTCSVTIPSSTAGNLIAIFCEGQTSLPTAVADNATGGSNTYTEVIGSRGSQDTGIAMTSIWYSQTTHAGATTVTCTSASDCYGSGANEYSGLLTSGNPVDASSGTVHVSCLGSVCTAATLTTTNAGDVIYVAGIPGNSLLSVAAPYTDFLGGTGNGQATCSYIPGATVSGSAAVFTNSSSDSMGSSAVAFLPAPGGLFNTSSGTGNIVTRTGTGTISIK